MISSRRITSGHVQLCPSCHSLSYVSPQLVVSEFIALVSDGNFECVDPMWRKIGIKKKKLRLLSILHVHSPFSKLSSNISEMSESEILAITLLKQSQFSNRGATLLKVYLEVLVEFCSPGFLRKIRGQLAKKRKSLYRENLQSGSRKIRQFRSYS